MCDVELGLLVFINTLFSRVAFSLPLSTSQKKFKVRRFVRKTLLHKIKKGETQGSPFYFKILISCFKKNDLAYENLYEIWVSIAFGCAGIVRVHG
jgi:hypothetical protein